jgi:hypothetical protein
MNGQPLTSSDNLKLLIFAMISIVTALLIVGIIPAIIIFYSILMTKKHHDFSHIETVAKFLEIIFSLILLGSIAVFFINAYGEFYQYPDKFHQYPIESILNFIGDQNVGTGSFVVVAGALTYYLSLHYLYHKPLKRHSKWVEHNPIFFKGSKSTNGSTDDPKTDIIKGEKLKQYSVADELMKWAKLKEDGHISEEEFQEARDKLLKKH